ncbi:thiamine-phosphate kinase [Sphingomonas sp. AOB5]|uniref:thiamine-phosphate kinase n=1 Tax=Sphingomonas sp. AOB5 TaxID=3034017 RepID=UPI0023F97836|nr:thiamine-phosphate kinase [Sphingomonas sp. AOB5]MDF7777578.1 thiamine-phosphate kinase [Sphingomonas sp. AOB5]
MSDEFEFHALLTGLASAPGARGLLDDAALLDGLVLTTDTMVEGIHYLASDPPEAIGWKLAAVNLSDLAAKGAAPAGCLLNHALSGDAAWDAAFLSGLGEALDRYAMPLLGGDTVAMPKGAPRSYSLTAIGRAGATVPSRAGAQPGDGLWVTGTIGGAGAGLAIARAGKGDAALLARYRRPEPRMAEGLALAPQVHAMMDISDGLLLDAQRMAHASGLAVTIDLALVPLAAAYPGTPLEAATAGDDYELLFAAPAGFLPPLPATQVGSFAAGSNLTLIEGGAPVALPAALGYSHRA